MKSHLRRFSLLLMLTATLSAQSTKPETLDLWTGVAPGDKPGMPPEADTTGAKDRPVAGKPVIRLGNVSKPTMAIYPAAKGKATGAAVIVFPGGGYRILAYDLEGTEVCQWLNSIGVTCALVKYRVPAREGGPRYAAPLQDAQRAIGMLRQNAARWSIDPARIGVLGFSAGGHLAAALSNNYDKRTYDAVDAADQMSCRPDFVVLVYPGYLTLQQEPTKVSPELAVSARTPPTFIVQTEDDSVPVEGSLFYYAALKQAKVPAEMHLYAKGGHGYGLRPSADPVSVWPKRLEEWMRTTGVLRASK